MKLVMVIVVVFDVIHKRPLLSSDGKLMETNKALRSYLHFHSIVYSFFLPVYYRSLVLLILYVNKA